MSTQLEVKSGEKAYGTDQIDNGSENKTTKNEPCTAEDASESEESQNKIKESATRTAGTGMRIKH